jgi:hypothetical protein
LIVVEPAIMPHRNRFVSMPEYEMRSPHHEAATRRVSFPVCSSFMPVSSIAFHHSSSGGAALPSTAGAYYSYGPPPFAFFHPPSPPPPPQPPTFCDCGYSSDGGGSVSSYDCCPPAALPAVYSPPVSPVPSTSPDADSIISKW